MDTAAAPPPVSTAIPADSVPRSTVASTTTSATPVNVSAAPTIDTPAAGDTVIPAVGPSVPGQPAPAVPLSDTAPSTTATDATPVVAAADHHLAADDHVVLPVGQGIKTQKQADHLNDDTQDSVVDAQVEKVKAQKRELEGEDPKGTVVDGIEDDKLWALMRRWNVQVTHTLSPPTKLPAGEPDLRPSTLPDVPFNSDILKSNIERVYATFGVSAIYTARELQRLMSWSPEDRKRTAAFAIAYFTAAWFTMAVPLIVALLIVLTVYPPSRKFFFPPVHPPPGVPASATDPTNQKGDESLLVGVGHPIVHRSKVEQVEQQAWEFTNTVQRFGVRVVMGGQKYGKTGNGSVGRKEADDDSDDTESELEEEVRENGGDVVDVHEAKTGEELSAKQKRKLKAKEAKEKRDKMVGTMAKTTQDTLGDFADALERIQNALSPPKTYPKNFGREKLAGAIFAPIFLATALIPAHLWAQAATFSFGIVFFGQPFLIRAAKKFVELVPDWQERLDLRNSIFSQVPTNAQVTLHILRQAEAQFSPLPAPPKSPTSEELKEEIAKGGIVPDEGMHEGEILEAKGHDAENEEDQPSLASKVASKGAKKFLGGLRVAAKKAATFRGDVTVDNTRAKVGSKIDRVLYHSRAKDKGTMESYPAKLNGTSGHITINYSPSHPIRTVSFHPLNNPEKVIFEQPINDLVEVKKRGVFIGRAVLGWAASINIEGMGLEMRFKEPMERAVDGLGKGEKKHEETHEGEIWDFSHVGRRDQLFTRLVSIGNQKWESL